MAWLAVVPPASGGEIELESSAGGQPVYFLNRADPALIRALLIPRPGELSVPGASSPTIAIATDPAAGALTVGFGLGSADLTPRARKTLELFCTAFSTPDAAGLQLNVVGHACAAGSDATNKSLSIKRAQAVAAFFDACQPMGVTAEGHGEAELLAGYPPVHARHRRVEISVQRPRTW